MPRAVNRSRAGAFIGKDCAVQKGNVLAINEGVLTLKKRGEDSPPIGEELPMELTAAIMAIMSFGFLAAVILGMI
jgi:hypothetical protein